MLTREEKNRVIDYFDAWELVAFLQISTRDVLDAFEDEIEDALDEINELMGLKGANDNELED